MTHATRPAIFKWRQTAPELILCAVRWYLRYSLSLRKGLGVTSVNALFQSNQWLSQRNGQATWMGSSARLDPALLIEPELFVQEEILDSERAFRSKPENQEAK